MKTGTLLLLGGIALLAVKSGALGRLASATSQMPFKGSLGYKSFDVTPIPYDTEKGGFQRSGVLIV
jgi:hypothetical protein